MALLVCLFSFSLFRVWILLFSTACCVTQCNQVWQVKQVCDSLPYSPLYMYTCDDVDGDGDGVLPPSPQPLPSPQQDQETLLSIGDSRGESLIWP